MAAERAEKVARAVAGCCLTVRAGSTDNIKAVARAVCAKMLPGDDTGGEKLAAEVEIFWHMVVTELEVGIVDEISTRPLKRIGENGVLL